MWGFKNKEGKIMIPPGKYSFLNPIDEHGMILAQKDGKEGYIDITEKVLIPFIYDNVGVFSTRCGIGQCHKRWQTGIYQPERRSHHSAGI
ncbi:WG repeat-containing protein [Bacteroides thetaiotaomicron]|nr:WG repeat-containing protein [Bacteroides thetaiotaomicron]